MDHVDNLPDIVHLAEWSIGFDDYKWSVTHIEPVQNMQVILKKMNNLTDQKDPNILTLLNNITISSWKKT